jgi:DNA adenine methylase
VKVIYLFKIKKMEKAYKTYNGSKSGNGTYQNIINFIPKCDILIEAFAGNASIIRKIKRPDLSVLNDIDPSVIDKYNCDSLPPGILVKNDDYRSIINEFDSLSNVFFYFDPPYLFETRKSKQRLYRFEFSDSDHVEFITMVQTVKSNCMISHYPCALYEEGLSSWKTFDFQSMTRQGLRTERLYMNYDTPVILQDYQYLGKDFIERQQIKRKTKRLLQKLAKLPTIERQALITSIIEKYNYERG